MFQVHIGAEDSDADEHWLQGIRPSAGCDDEILDNRMISTDRVPTATVIQQLLVLFQVKHVVHRVVKSPERHLVGVVISSCKAKGVSSAFSPKPVSLTHHVQSLGLPS